MPKDQNTTEKNTADWIADPNSDSPLPEKPAFDSPTMEAYEKESLGIPEQPLGKAQTIDKEKSRLLGDRSRENAEMEEKALAAMQEYAKANQGFFSFNWLKHLLLALSGLGIVVLFTQALSFIALLNDLPNWAKYSGYGFMGLLCILVIWSMAKFLFSYMRFEQSPRVSLQAMRSLEQRASLRKQAHNQLNEAKERLLKILSEYPLQKNKQVQLAALGFSEEDIQQMKKAQGLLLESAKEESTEAWLMQFEQRFVSLLDKNAKKRITRRAWLVGIKTAAAPTGFLSAAIVLINAYQLISELCGIYRLRSGGVGTASILMRVFVNAFAASQMEEWMDQATQGIIGSAATGTDTAAAFFKVLAGGVMSRAAEGGANAFLLIRLGVAGMHYLRPVTEKDK